MKQKTRVVLASQSPRRQLLLRQIGLTFVVHASNIAETMPFGQAPAEVATHLALQKAESVAGLYPNAITLGADTIVVLGDEILNKPRDAADAFRMLRTLSGRTHVVYTGMALVHPDSNRTVTASEETRVTFAPLTDREIEAYVATGSPLDKAGAYGIQDDLGAVFISRIEGDYYNVVGLPLHRLYRLLCENFTGLVGI